MDEKKYLQNTGAVYGNLFDAYSKKQFNESVKLFFMRHKKWGVDLDWFKGKVCLDAGCGGGRFMVALASLGAREVKGIDISEAAVRATSERLKERCITNATTIQASVLKIPFPDNYFDYVISSGVIHHTPNPRRAFHELVRVLKPQGKLFLSVYGKGGLKWFVNDFFRYSICKIVPFKILEKLFILIGVPANKRYNTLDNLYVPYIFRFKEYEICNWLEEAGFQNAKRLKFERYDYEKPLTRIIHGEGWIQIYADKK